MKKLISIFAVCSVLACGGNKQENDNNDTANANGKNKMELDGGKLISKSDCRACHSEKGKVIGPGYQEVAERYPMNDSTISYLAGKITLGGAGNWGDNPMPPHPQHTQEEAEAMVRYILSLK